MDEREKILVERHSKAEIVTDIIAYAVMAGYTWYLVNPDSFTRFCGGIADACDKLKFRISVWRAKEAINSLPTTDITDVTRHDTQP